MRVLALDIGTNFAAAFDGPGGKPAFVSAYHRMPRESEGFGPIFAWFSEKVRDILALPDKPEVIGCEAPWIAYNKDDDDKPTPLNVAYLLLGMTAIAETVAQAHGIAFKKCHIGTIRKDFMGDGTAKKPAMFARCKALGWNPKNQHESDAGALYAHLKLRNDRTFILPPPGMLFASARVTA